jgi:DNA-binding helix-hairpin-helix protein with protein kinase domain
MEVTFSDGATERYSDQRFASGRQGEIFKSFDGKHVVKLHQPGSGTAARKSQIDAIIGKYNAVGHDAYWEELFAWPDKRAERPRMGVRMRFVGDLTSIDHFFFQPSFEALAPEKRGWWIGRVAVAIKMARAVERLSNLGLCHSDLSERNLLVDAFDGRMTILDCDSLVIPNVMPPDVLGTKEYMAPELMSLKERTPSVVTDRHALAVLLYRWLLYKHPLLGPKQHSPDSDKDEALALGERALFIEHPIDMSNRLPHMNISADSLTPRVRELFHQTFVEALHVPTKRPTAGAWEEALIEMFDHIIPCANPSCVQRFFVAQEMGPLRCSLCGTPVTYPPEIPFLKLRKPVLDNGVWHYRDEGHHSRFVVGWPERPLYSWHADPNVKAAPDAKGNRPDHRPQAYIRCIYVLIPVAESGCYKTSRSRAFR